MLFWIASLLFWWVLYPVLAVLAIAMVASLARPFFLGVLRCTTGIARGQNITIVPSRTAVVVVGGDFARSPRMQYHAVSLAQTGVVARVELVGLDHGNKLCEDLLALKRSGKVGTSGLVKPPTVPRIGLIRRVWLFATLYRVIVFMLRFSWSLWCATLPSAGPVVVSEPGDAHGTRRHLSIHFYYADIALIQTPPAVPFVPLLRAVLTAHRYAAMTLCWFVFPVFGVVSGAAAAIAGTYQHKYRRSGARRSTSRYRAALVVDWHNFGFSLLEVDRRPRLAVKLYRFFEENFCAGDANFTVSHAMRAVLAHDKGNIPNFARLNLPHKDANFGIAAANIAVVHDTAPAFFAPCTRDEFLATVVCEGREIEPPAWFSDPAGCGVDGYTIVSATSWTADDDYTLVVDALKQLDAVLAGTAKRVWFVVTGKGESRGRFEDSVRAAAFSERIAVTTVYFQSFKSYARMIGVADVGLCVHRSASGLDLPMKVVDMFGCGLPVLALGYPALPELVTEANGWCFDDAASLFAYLKDIVARPGGREVVAAKKRFLIAQRTGSWSDEWKAVALPVIADVVGAGDFATTPAGSQHRRLHLAK